MQGIQLQAPSIWELPRMEVSCTQVHARTHIDKWDIRARSKAPDIGPPPKEGIPDSCKSAHETAAFFGQVRA